MENFFVQKLFRGKGRDVWVDRTFFRSIMYMKFVCKIQRNKESRIIQTLGSIAMPKLKFQPSSDFTIEPNLLLYAPLAKQRVIGRFL